MRTMSMAVSAVLLAITALAYATGAGPFAPTPKVSGTNDYESFYNARLREYQEYKSQSKDILALKAQISYLEKSGASMEATNRLEAERSRKYVLQKRLVLTYNSLAQLQCEKGRVLGGPAGSEKLPCAIGPE